MTFLGTEFPFPTVKSATLSSAADSVKTLSYIQVTFKLHQELTTISRGSSPRGATNFRTKRVYVSTWKHRCSERDKAHRNTLHDDVIVSFIQTAASLAYSSLDSTKPLSCHQANMARMDRILTRAPVIRRCLLLVLIASPAVVDPYSFWSCSGTYITQRPRSCTREAGSFRHTSTVC